MSLVKGKSPPGPPRHHVGFLGNPKTHPNCQIRASLAGTPRPLYLRALAFSVMSDAGNRSYTASLCPKGVVRKKLARLCPVLWQTQHPCGLLRAHKPKATEREAVWAHLTSLLLFRLRNLLGNQTEDAVAAFCSLYSLCRHGMGVGRLPWEMLRAISVLHWLWVQSRRS